MYAGLHVYCVNLCKRLEDLQFYLPRSGGLRTDGRLLNATVLESVLEQKLSSSLVPVAEETATLAALGPSGFERWSCCHCFCWFDLN